MRRIECDPALLTALLQIRAATKLCRAHLRPIFEAARLARGQCRPGPASQQWLSPTFAGVSRSHRGHGDAAHKEEKHMRHADTERIFSGITEAGSKPVRFQMKGDASPIR